MPTEPGRSWPAVGLGLVSSDGTMQCGMHGPPCSVVLCSTGMIERVREPPAQ